MSNEPTDNNLEIIDEQEYEEKKSYVNFGCFQLSLGIIFTYIYIIASILINIINRIIFLTTSSNLIFFFYFYSNSYV
jgi:hypothetical protein